VIDDAAAIWPAESLSGGVERWQLPRFEARSGAPPTAEALQAVEAAAYEEGFARGQREGFAVGQKAALDQAQRLRQLVDHLARPLAGLDEAMEHLLIDLAAAIAQRLLTQDLQARPERVLELVHTALAALPPQVRKLRIHAHPEDGALLREQLFAPPQIDSLQVVDDRELQRGDCRLVTESTLVDGRLDQRILSIARSLQEESS
jgi:flagellar assembly protein FliH